MQLERFNKRVVFYTFTKIVCYTLIQWPNTGGPDKFTNLKTSLFTCNFCDESFRTLSELIKHNKIIHSRSVQHFKAMFALTLRPGIFILYMTKYQGMLPSRGGHIRTPRPPKIKKRNNNILNQIMFCLGMQLVAKIQNKIYSLNKYSHLVRYFYGRQYQERSTWKKTMASTDLYWYWLMLPGSPSITLCHEKKREYSCQNLFALSVLPCPNTWSNRIISSLTRVFNNHRSPKYFPTFQGPNFVPNSKT